jgi:GNAT superfamily N-acetyltransferase
MFPGTITMHSFFIRPISANDTHDLRLRVLRPGQPPERANYVADEQSDAFHLGAFTADGTLGGVASFYPEPFPHDAQQLYYDETPSDWRLRGMAVEPDLQGQGVGRALIIAGIETLQEKAGVWLWCNARTTAEPFYTTLGFNTFGDPFEMAEIGTHYLMARQL